MRFFDLAYEGTPPWDIGRPQAAVVRLAGRGAIAGSVLDMGCGTGEHALFLAARGHDVVGVDLSERAIERARAKARERGIEARFLVSDALEVDWLGRTFDTAIDVGLFHTLADGERTAYARSLHGALNAGGRCFVLCWSERNPWGFGPRRVSQMELLGAFERGWAAEPIADEELESSLDRPIHAWLATFRRAGA